MTTSPFVLVIFLLLLVGVFIAGLLIRFNPASINLMRRRLLSSAKSSAERSGKQSQQVLETAQAKADKIIRDAHLLSRGIEDKLQKSLQQVGEEASRNMAKMGKNASAQVDELLNTLIVQYKERWESSLQSFEESGQRQLKKLQAEIVDTVQNEVEETRKALAKLRRKEEKRVAQQMEKKIPALLKQITGRSIPVKIHEDLVREALNKLPADNEEQTG